MALAWCFPDESSEYADQVLVALEGKTVLVPAVWSLEVGNAMLVGERRKRLGAADLRRFIQLISSLTIQQDALPIGESLGQVVTLAREQNLTTYDAAYLELAIRHGAPLASLDDKLRTAAKKMGTATFPA